MPTPSKQETREGESTWLSKGERESLEHALEILHDETPCLSDVAATKEVAIAAMERLLAIDEAERAEAHLPTMKGPLADVLRRAGDWQSDATGAWVWEVLLNNEYKAAGHGRLDAGLVSSAAAKAAAEQAARELLIDALAGLVPDEDRDHPDAERLEHYLTHGGLTPSGVVRIACAVIARASREARKERKP